VIRNEYQPSPKINPAQTASNPPTKESTAKEKNCRQLLTSKVLNKSETKVEKVLKLPKNPTEININNDDTFGKEFNSELGSQAKNRPSKKAEKTFTAIVPQCLKGKNLSNKSIAYIRIHEPVIAPIATKKKGLIAKASSDIDPTSPNRRRRLENFVRRDLNPQPFCTIRTFPASENC